MECMQYNGSFPENIAVDQIGEMGWCIWKEHNKEVA